MRIDSFFRFLLGCTLAFGFGTMFGAIDTGDRALYHIRAALNDGCRATEAAYSAGWRNGYDEGRWAMKWDDRGLALPQFKRVAGIGVQDGLTITLRVPKCPSP